MPTRVHCLVVVAVYVFIGCDSDPVAPDGALVGTWGSRDMIFRATAATVQIETPCGRSSTGTPVVPDPSGRFVIALPNGSEIPSTSATVLRGIAAEGILSLDLITVFEAETYTQSVTLLKDQTPPLHRCVVAG